MKLKLKLTYANRIAIRKNCHMLFTDNEVYMLWRLGIVCIRVTAYIFRSYIFHIVCVLSFLFFFFFFEETMLLQQKIGEKTQE